MVTPNGVSNLVPEQDFWFRNRPILQLLGLAVLVVFAQLKLNFYLRIPTETDPGCFEAIAFAMSQGQQLYIDVWDHKPPGVFYLNQWALELFGPSETAIYWLQSSATFFTSIVLFRLLQLFVKSWVWAAVLGIFFYSVWMEPGKFGSGNYTEQYGMLWTLTGHVLVCKAWLDKKGNSYLYLGAACFGMALLFKESFAFSSLAFFVILLLEKGAWRAKIWRFALSVSCLLLPFGLYVLTLVVKGQLEGWFSAVQHTAAYGAQNVAIPVVERIWLNFGFFYSRVASFFPWLCMAILPMFFMWRRLERKRYVVYFALVLLGEFVATALPGNFYEHYYLPITATVFMFIGIALEQYIALLDRYKIRLLQPLLLVVLLLLAPKGFYSKCFPEMELRFPGNGDGIVQYLRTEARKGDRLAIANYDMGRYYLQSGLLPVSRYPVPFNYHLIAKGHEKAVGNMDQIIDARPRFIVGKEPFAEFLFVAKFNPWLKEHYREVFSENDVRVWERR